MVFAFAFAFAAAAAAPVIFIGGLLEFESVFVKYNITILVCLKGALPCLEYTFRVKHFLLLHTTKTHFSEN
jgi:hypothetical protein